MKSWKEQLDSLSSSKVRDLYSYLWECEDIDAMHDEDMKQSILHGRRQDIFKLLNKDAYKTMRRLFRHQEKKIDTIIYPVEQLLTLGFAIDKGVGDHHDYKLHPQALPFIQVMYKTRHYETYIKYWDSRDILTMGLLHWYGILELPYLCAYLAKFHITCTPQDITKCIRWRLSIRDHVQLTKLHCNKHIREYILLQECDTSALCECIESIEYDPCLPYTFEEIEQWKDRYYALHNLEIQIFIQMLLERFSHRFALHCAKEMIDAYQYHNCTFSSYNTIIRVLDKDKIAQPLRLAIASLDDILHMQHMKS